MYLKCHINLFLEITIQGAGLKLEDALAFWRAEFSQKVYIFFDINTCTVSCKKHVTASFYHISSVQ
jgi:hypothetical protein